MTNEHEMLSEGAGVIDRAREAIHSGTPAAARSGIDEVYDYLSRRFLPHARVDADRCARLALRDHRHPEGTCGEPEVEALTQRLEHVKVAFDREGSTAGMKDIAESLLAEIAPKVHAHLSDVETAHVRGEHAETHRH